MFNIFYIPRIQDEVVVASFKTKEQAEDWMDNLAEINPAVLPHHYIKEIKDKCVE